MYPFRLDVELCDNSSVLSMVMDDDFAGELYAALCNVVWRKTAALEDSDRIIKALKGDNAYWSITWRGAGGVVADMRNIISDEPSEIYLDWYCGGNEGQVSLRVAEILKRIGWEYEIHG